MVLHGNLEGTLEENFQLGPSEDVGFRKDSTQLKLRDEDVGEHTLADLLTVGLTKEQHDALRSLIHFIDDGPAEGFPSLSYKEILPAGSPFPTQVIWWESSSKLKKIVEKTITRSGGGATNPKPTPIVWKMYDTDGTTVLVTVSDAITYSGIFEVSRTRTIS
jgi:hypothetical protein